MGSILSIIGLIILAVLKLEQFVYGKSPYGTAWAR